MLLETRFRRCCILLLLGLCAHIKAEASSENVHDPPVVTPNFYDPNYHDDGRNHLRGPTAASSSSTISVMSPYAAASNSAGREVYNNKPGATTSNGGGTIMAIVDHFYGPNGEEQVKYSSPNQMDKDEFEQILASLGSSGSTPSKLTYNSPSTPQHSPKHVQYSHSPPPKQSSPPPTKYGGGAPLSSLYKSSSSPSYTSTVPTAGYSLPSLYKSSSENSYSNKPPATYRPAYSTIYKDPPFSGSAPKPHNHYNKGSTEYSPSHYGKDPVHLHSPKEPSYMKPPSYYPSGPSPHSPPKSISDAIYADMYPTLKGVSNIIDHDDSYPYAHSPSYPPPQSHPHPRMPHHHPQMHHDISSSLAGSNEYALNAGKYYSPSVPSEYSHGKGSLKAGLHSLPVKYSGSHGPEYGISSSPPTHHDAYSAGFGGGYSLEESNDPYSHPSTKGYMNRPPSSPYASTPPSHSTGHSLSSFYQPLAFDELYNSPKSKPMYSNGGVISMPKPGYGAPSQPPSAYALSYGPPVEYRMPPKGIGYTTSSRPYGGPPPPPGFGAPKYKGPYRTVMTGPQGYLHGYGYGKPHGGHHDDQHKTSQNDGISLAKDEYEDEAKYIRPPPPLSSTPEQPPSSPPSSLPPHLLQEHLPPQLVAPISASPEEFHHPHVNPVDSYLPSYPSPYHHDNRAPVHHHPPSHSHRPHHHSHNPHEGHANEISHSPPRPTNSNQQEDSSEEIHHIHVFEKNFFGKEKRLQNKEKHHAKWRPVARNYRFGSGSGEGGHGSASMERDARAAEEEGVAHRDRRHRLPPPSRRRPMSKSNKRPYHSTEIDEEHEGHGRIRPSPHYNHHHSHPNHGRRS